MSDIEAIIIVVGAAHAINSALLAFIYWQLRIIARNQVATSTLTTQAAQLAAARLALADANRESPGPDSRAVNTRPTPAGK